MAKAKAKKNTLLRVSVILFLLYVVISLVQIQGSIQKNREQLGFAYPEEQVLVDISGS